MPEGNRPVTLDHLRSNKKRLTKKVTLSLDPNLAAELDEARTQAKVLQLRAGAASDSPELQEAAATATQRVAELEASSEDKLVTFHFESLSRDDYEELLLANQPTPEQEEEAKEKGVRLPWNPETYYKALVAASLVDPALTLEEVHLLWKDPNWTAPELGVLAAAAEFVNSERSVQQLGKG